MSNRQKSFMQLSPVKLIRLGLFATALFAASAGAHHGFVSYLEENYTLTGTVTDMYFGFPHPQLSIEADGETWNLWLAAFGLVRFVCLPEQLSVGDKITAVGHRVPDLTRLEMKAKQLTLQGKRYDFYPPENPLGGNPNPTRDEPCTT